MLGVSFKLESQGQIDAYKRQLTKRFPERDVDAICTVLELYDSAYIAAREYFAYYFSMGTETIIKYVNSIGVGFCWEFLKNAVFDEGINVLWRFYDQKSGKNNSTYEHILQQCEKVFGEEISTRDSSAIREIRKYRHNNAAHCGNGFHEASTSIRHDSPLEALETLRLDRLKFDKEKRASQNTLYCEELCDYFSQKVHHIARVLNDTSIKTEKVIDELSKYVRSVCN